MIPIANDKVVSINYILTDDDNNVIDSSDGKDPLIYIQGHGNVIPGLEKALEGKITSDKLMVRIAPEDAYGIRDESLKYKIPKTTFQGEVEEGMQFQLQTPAGIQLITAIGKEGEDIILDGNHPLAGFNLNFEVEVMDVRDATPEELSHGHIHDGCDCE